MILEQRRIVTKPFKGGAVTRGLAWALPVFLAFGTLQHPGLAETPGEASGQETSAPPAIFSPATRARADALLAQMTLEEKTGQLTQLFLIRPPKDLDALVAAGRFGSFFLAKDPAEVDRLQHLAVDKSRLHIPLLFGNDIIHGYTTVFPVPLAMAASFDPALVEKEQAIAASEALAGGTHWTYGAMVDINRDPRWGRMVEGAGEDPYLGSVMARAQVRGFQGPAIGSPDHILASMKHFAGYGAAEGGRDHDAANISDAQLHNVYLPPFRAAVQAGVGSVVTAYMDLNDVPATGNYWLLHDLLRQDWGFQGFVVSDANAINSLVPHGFAKDQEDAAVRALTAGVNMELVLSAPAYATLPDAWKRGLVTTAQLDDAVRPILEAKIQLGLFEHPYIDAAHSQQVLAKEPEYRAEARIAAERSAVLLRNDGNVLPLAKTSYKKIAVIGPLGDSKADMIGPWVFAKNTGVAVTVAEGLRAKLGSSAQVEISPGVQIRRLYPSPFEHLFLEKTPPTWDDAQTQAAFGKALELARGSDLVVLALGETQEMIGESSSRSSLDLPGDQERLMESIVALGKPVVLVLVNGRPLDISWANAHVSAILEAWYPGTEGGAAIANLLFGDTGPGGKLPFTWPRNAGQLPIYYAHMLTQDPKGQDTRYWNEPSTPLFPFGYGLTYSSFMFSDLKLNHAPIKTGGSTEVTATVENTGDVAADQVAQLYLHQQYGGASRPVRELKGFERLHLAPHEKRVVQFSLGPDDLSYWNSAKRHWVTEPSTFDVWVGEDSRASLHTTFDVMP